MVSYLDEFIYVEGGRNLPNNKFMRNEIFTIDKIGEYRKKNGNRGLYVTAYVYNKSETKEADIYGDFYLDFDSEEDINKAREDALTAIWYMRQKFKYDIPQSFFRIYFSGKKGFHITVPAVVLGAEPGPFLNEYYRLMAKEIDLQVDHGTLDLKIYDRRRLFRLQNSVHNKTNLYKIPITYEELKNASVDEIINMAKTPRAPSFANVYEVSRAKAEFQKHVNMFKNRYERKFKKDGFASKPLGFTPSCIEDLINEGPVPGKRNNVAAALVSFYKKEGMSEQQVWNNMTRWNQGSMTDGELETVLKSVYEGNYEYGCSTLEVLSTCIGDKCKLYKEDR